VSTTRTPHSEGSGRSTRPADRELRLDPLLHGTGRVPGQQRPMFDLAAFAGALEHHDVAYQLGCYAVDADIRVVDPDSPPPEARTVRGRQAIGSWLHGSDAFGVEVTHLVDGGDRFAFTARWERRDGTAVVATSTAELSAGLIATQHTILAWSREPLGPVDGWTRLSKELWTRAD
jgi:hypothetical protein